MRGYPRITAAIFAGAFAVSGCAYAANDADEMDIVIKMDGEGPRHSHPHDLSFNLVELHTEIMIEVEAELADAMEDIQDAVEDLADAKIDMIEAQKELAELDLGPEMRAEMDLEFKQALIELEQAKEDLARAKVEMQRAKVEIREAIASESGEIHFDLEFANDPEHKNSVGAGKSPMVITPQDDEFID